jgi:hypothetical protein
MAVRQSRPDEWKPGELTDSELAARRCELERKIGVLAPESPRRVQLKAELDAVVEEITIRPELRRLPLADQLTPMARAMAASRVAEIDL